MILINKSQDSFFGQDELDRFFPDHKLRLAVVTWNMSSKPPCDGNLEANSYQRTLRSILMPKYPEISSSKNRRSSTASSDNYLHRLPELYVIGLQETPKSEVVVGQLKVALQAALGPNYALLQWSAVGVLHASIWLRRELLWSCTAVDTVPIHSRPTAANRIRTKGAVALSFSLFGTAFLFINTHLSAHETNLRTRINQLDKVQQILNLKLKLANGGIASQEQQRAALLNARQETNSAPTTGEVFVERNDNQNSGQNGDTNEQEQSNLSMKNKNPHSEYVFWFGDLNFRLELPRESVATTIRQITTAPSNEGNNDLFLKLEKYFKI